MRRDDWSRDLGNRRGEGRCAGEDGRRLKSPEGERAKEVYSGKSGRWIWVLRLLLRVQALYLVLKFSCMSCFGSLKCPKVMELSTIKRTSGSSALRSHSSGCLHTQEEH